MDTGTMILNEFETIRKGLCVPYKITFRNWFSDFWFLILIYSFVLSVIIWILVAVVTFFLFKCKKVDHPLKNSLKKLLRLWWVFLLILLVIAVVFFVYYLNNTWHSTDLWCEII